MSVLAKISTALSTALIVLAGADLLADPGRSSALQPVFALSGRAADPEHLFNPLEVVPAPTSSTALPRLDDGSGDDDVFASADPEVPASPGAPLQSPSPRAGSSDWVSASDNNGFAFYSDPEPVSEVSFRDYQDTLIRSDRDYRVQTLVGEGGERLPESWALPPGQVPGGYPGYRRDVSPVNYASGPGVAYYPPPTYDRSPRASSYGYPVYGGYHPGGPYAYQYDGMVPLDDPTYYEDASFEFEGDFPIVTRQFDPEQAHFKAGPFYFQALWVETGVLYSDYNGPEVFAPGEEDGWLGYASFRFRMTARLSPSLYLTADGEIIYLFGENELGFRSGFGGGPFARLVYETQLGSWDFRAYAEFGTSSFYDAFGDEAFERAGRYSFGFLGQYDNGLLYDPYLYTRVGVEASTLVNPDWRLTLLADHTDYWYVGNDDRDDHHSQEHLGIRYGAEPNRVPFTPWFSYDLYSNDSFDSAYHTIYAGASGRLSENVFWDGRAGYFWTSNDFSEQQSWLWNIGLRHRINSRTTHGIRFGQDFFLNDFSIDTTVSSFFQYYITHQVSERASLHAYAQWSTDEFLSGPLVGGEYESEIYGIWLRYNLSERLDASLGYMEEERRNTRTGDEFERSVFQARLDARITERTTAYLLYQHEDTDFYYEDLYMAGIRRYF